jgi:hypothetical protein
MRNVLARWISHAKSCPGLGKTVMLAPEAQAFVLQCMAGGDKHRRITCDAYTTTYWVYKYKLPFTTSPKLKEVYYPNPSCIPNNPNPDDDVLDVQLLQSLNCVDKDAVVHLRSSKTTCDLCKARPCAMLVFQRQDYNDDGKRRIYFDHV